MTTKIPPRSKHTSCDYHLLQENVQKVIIHVFPIKYKDQIPDMFTKLLMQKNFLGLRKKLLNFWHRSSWLSLADKWGSLKIQGLCLPYLMQYWEPISSLLTVFDLIVNDDPQTMRGFTNAHYRRIMTQLWSKNIHYHQIFCRTLSSIQSTTSLIPQLWWPVSGKPLGTWVTKCTTGNLVYHWG